MSTEVVTTAYGPAAHEALAAAVRSAKGSDPLAPVTVVVPANTVGIAARRRLGRMGLDGRDGIAAVRFLTPYSLAELVGQARTASSRQRPVSKPVIAAAVRAALRDDPGYFAGVSTHPATERALVQAHRELSESDRAALSRLARTSPRAADVVRVHRRVCTALEGRFSNEQTLVDAAVEALRRGEFPVAELGRLVVYLPQNLTTTQARLLVEVAEQTPAVVVAGVTGVAGADAAVSSAVERLGASLGPATPVDRRTGHFRILSVSDPDEEVRHALRAVMEAARRGVPLARCAIVYGTADPYSRLLGDALDAAGIDWNGATVDTAETSLLGRSLLAMLALADDDFPRRDLMAWLASAPVLHDASDPDPAKEPASNSTAGGSPVASDDAGAEPPEARRGRPRRQHVPSDSWERVARNAGVTGGLAQWQERLARHVQSREDAAAEADRDDAQEARARHLRREAAEARTLARFVERLAQDLEAGRRATKWSSLAAWCRRLVHTYFGDARWREGARDGRGRWPDHERRFATAVGEALDRLGHLDGIDDEPSLVPFRRALQMELEGSPSRRGNFGRGVLVGTPNAALGAEMDLVVVLGLAEGTFPARRREDPLLPDRERVVVGGDLPLRSAHTDDDHRALLAALAAASEALLLYPRGDLRQAAERAPSRWLLDIVEAREQIRPSTEDLARSGIDWLSEVPSFVAGLRQTVFPAHAQEYDMRALLGWHDQHRPISEHWLMDQRTELQRGVELTLARRSRRFTRFDGNLSSDGDLRNVTLPHPCDESQIVSASRLEAWAGCPHAYFVRYVLRVDAVEDPDESYRITPLDRGNLLHRILDLWMSEAIDRGHVPDPGKDWSTGARQRLREIAEQECDRIQKRGMAGRRLYWERDRAQILEELERSLVFDTEMRARYRSRPIASELGFAMPRPTDADTTERKAPVTVALGSSAIRPTGGDDEGDTEAAGLVHADQRSLAVRGSIDRVDETDSGGLVVIDYKTGSSRSYKNLSADDPTPSGGHLQLVLYTLAAREILRRPDASARGDYWFVSRRGGFTSHGYIVDRATETRVLATVGAIVEGIGAGLFPLHPERPGWRAWIPCRYCEPDGLGTRDVWRDWERKRTHGDLSGYTSLVEPESLDARQGTDRTAAP